MKSESPLKPEPKLREDSLDTHGHSIGQPSVAAAGHLSFPSGWRLLGLWVAISGVISRINGVI